MKLGIFLPISGRATGPDTLMEAAQSAEAQGFDAVWARRVSLQPGDRIAVYVTSPVSGFVATAEVESAAFRDTTPIWTPSSTVPYPPVP